MSLAGCCRNKKQVDQLEARDKKMSPGPGKELLLTAGVCGLGALLSVCTKFAANSDASASVAATPVNVGMMMLLCELIKLAFFLFMLHRREVWAKRLGQYSLSFKGHEHFSLRCLYHSE